MKLNKWLTGLAPCIIVLLLILSLSVVDIEGKKRGRKRHKGGRHGRGPPPSHGGVTVHPPSVLGPVHVGQRTGNIASIVVPTASGCPNPPPIGDVKKHINELWKEVSYLSNPIHIHVHGGQADGGHHSPHGRHHARSPGAKGHSHPKTSDGKEHHHPHTPGGKEPHHSHKHGGKEPHHSHKHGGKEPHHPHSHGGKHKHSHGGKGPGHTKKSHHGHHGSPRSPHETHIHIHITLDTNDTDDKPCEKPEESEDYEYARCDLTAPEKGSPVKGTVLLRQKANEPLEVKVNISGLPAQPQSQDPADHHGQHGFHVHEFADFSQGCASFGGHYNPENTTHGPANEEESHVGDWGNIECDSGGKCVTTMNITNSDLLGPSSIIGRGIVLHEGEDDLGEVGDKGSLTTGNAGKRLACCGIVRTGPPSSGDW